MYKYIILKKFINLKFEINKDLKIEKNLISIYIQKQLLFYLSIYEK